jgi:outer membrane beta-barrel protein
MDVLSALFVMLLTPTTSFAQESSDFTDLDQIEAELEQDRFKKSQDPGEEDINFSDKPEKEIKNLSDLRTLEPFGDVAVIHPRFQPKGKRFQFHLSGGAILNDPWFNHYGMSLKSAYHFSELLAAELAFDLFTGSPANATHQLASGLNVLASSFIRPKNYTGLHLYLSPIYGKMSLFNKRIVPYDVYFTLGLGQTGLEGARQNQVMTTHLGAGQIFAFSRNAAFRWDIRMNMFEAQGRASSGPKLSTQNVIMTVGFSYFFPEVSRR